MYRMEPNFSSEDCASGKQLWMNSWEKEWMVLNRFSLISYRLSNNCTKLDHTSPNQEPRPTLFSPAFQALLTGCSAGSLAALLHCDNFRGRFPHEVSVKCLSDAGFFIDE